MNRMESTSLTQLTTSETRTSTRLQTTPTNSFSSLLTTTNNQTTSTMTSSQTSQDLLLQDQHCQSPIRRSLVKTLRNNLHLKCLILTLLTGTCFLAIFWCSFARFTKVMINLHSFAFSRKQNACDQTYLYIPSVFVVAFYLLYLIECFHSETRFSLKHMEPSIQIINEIEKLKESLPVIWWKALNYHYLRRTRLITKYRNGEAYSTTQVYFQRINSRITSTCYVYDLNDGTEFGNTVTDISKKVINIDKFPLTRVRLSKGFAFSNLQAANAFEQQRNMFFSSSEQLDDFLEMREGMDLISSRFRDNMLCVSAKKPWYVSQVAFWLFSIFLLSWPYRILINWNTGILNYQIIKLFGNNSNNTETMNGDSIDERSNLTSNDDLLTNHCNLPPSYSIAMLYPPTYNYIKQLLYEQANENDVDQLDNGENVNYVLEQFDKYQRTANEQTNSRNVSNNKLNSTSAVDQQSNNQVKARIPSSFSCSFLNGQIVYLVNTLRNTTATLNSSIEHIAGHTSLDVKETTPDCMADCTGGELRNAKKNRVHIISAGNLHHLSIRENENNNLTLQIDNLNHELIIDEQKESKLNKLKMFANSSDLLLNTGKHISRSFTSESISSSYLKRFSNLIFRRIKSMQNLSAQLTTTTADVECTDVNV